MSTPQWPQQGGQQQGNGGSPWASPDPSWAPQSYRDTQGRDPLQPFGQQQAPQGPTGQPPRIEDFREPTRRSWMPLVVGGAIVLVIALLIGALQLMGDSSDDATPSPAASASAKASASPVEAVKTSIPFEGNGTGVFTLLDSSWIGDELTVRISVDLDKGSETFSLYLFNNETLQMADPDDPTPFRVTADAPAEVVVTFHSTPGDSSLTLASSTGRALTALNIPA